MRIIEMYACEDMMEAPHGIRFPEFKRIELADRECFETYVKKFQPISCEYNFANLFTWQDGCQFSWTLYQNRVLVYDAVSKVCFMPLGRALAPRDLVFLSVQLQSTGLSPDFILCPESYLKEYPEISTYYRVEEKREIAEYLYDVNLLTELTGEKLHKKKNLISQFKRKYPEYAVRPLEGRFRQKAFDLAQKLMAKYKRPSKTLELEFSAIQSSFDRFDTLGLEGLALLVEDEVVAFSVFSRLNDTTFDIQFEKSDIRFKGAAQLINQETAAFLQDRCRFLNREQDLGIEGLRQAKMSYDPIKLIQLYKLVFKSPA